jgi:hypothetical protein
MKIIRPEAHKDKPQKRDFSFTKSYQEKQKKIPPALFIIAALVICLVIVVVVVANRPDEKALMRESVRAAFPRTYESSKGKEVSMGEWMRKNNVETQMMKERKEQLQKHQAGQQTN